MFRRILKYRLVLGMLLLLVVMLASGLLASACATGARTQPKGWSGAIVMGDTLFLASMKGELVALDKETRGQLWPPQPLKVMAADSGLLGCNILPTCGTGGAAIVPIYGTPAASGDMVYIGGYNGVLNAFNASSGALRWVYPAQGQLEHIIGGPVVSGGKVFIGSTDSKLYALDAETGGLLWKFETGDRIWSTPAVEGDTLLVTSLDGKLYALSTDGTRQWEFTADGAIVASPLVHNGVVYIGSLDKYLYAVDVRDGSFKWRYQAENWFWAKPVVWEDVIYAPALDGKLYVLDAGSGAEVVMAIDLGSPVSSSPVVVDGLVVVATEEGKLYTIDTGTKRVTPLADLESKTHAPLGSGDGAVYVHIQKGNLLEIDVRTGAARTLYFFN
ncbi:PQQ-binding-like beta-propeller repeat protein [Chloroflexota bacterium]